MSEQRRYTLSSYDPVSITIEIPAPSPEEIQIVMNSMAEEKGGSEYDAKNLSWVRKNLGYDSMPAFTAAARREVEQAIEENAAKMRNVLCMAELAKRLEQEPGDELYKPIREEAAMRFKMELDNIRMGLRYYANLHNTTIEELSKKLDVQAWEEARGQAALAAYAAEKGIVAEEEEWPALMELPVDIMHQLIDKARQEGRYRVYSQAITNIKALRAVVAEADCTVVRPRESAE